MVWVIHREGLTFNTTCMEQVRIAAGTLANSPYVARPNLSQTAFAVRGVRA